jgi:hypothetical protein
VTDAPKPPEPANQPEIGVPAQPMPPPPSIPQARQPSAGEVDAEPAPGAGEPTPAPRSRGRTLRIVLASVLGALAVLCVGGLGTGYLLYRKVSEPDRSTPGVVVRQYVNATLNDRDDSRARLFTCRNSSGLAPVRALRDDNESKEKQFNVTISVNPEGFDTRQSGDNATVDVKLRLSVSTNGTFQEQIQSWRFTLKRESGWRVCSGEKLA